MTTVRKDELETLARLANTPTMDYCPIAPQIQPDKTHVFLARKAGLCDIPRSLTTEPSFGTNDDERASTWGHRMTRSRITRRTFPLSSLALATIGTGSLVSTSARADDAVARADDGVRHGIQTGALGALRTLLPSVETKYDKHIDFAFLAKATRQSPAQLSTW
jgi:hypothetical protein